MCTLDICQNYVTLRHSEPNKIGVGTHLTLFYFAYCENKSP